MYWICLVLFILAVFTPDIIQRDFSFIAEEKAEELIIFILGALTFLIFLQKEKQLFAKTKEKTKIQREASLASKDLADTYSYIGEINRKVDILKDIALGITEGPGLIAEKELEIYRSIIRAVQMFSKSDHVSLKFINIKTNETLKEIKSSRRARCDVLNGRMVQENKTFIETESAFFIQSPKPIDNITVCVAIKKRNKNQKIEDLELIKALASQALFLFTFSRGCQ